MQKYTLLMAPKMKLIFQISGLLQSGHPLVGPGPLLTDDKPLVEYFLSLPRDRDVDPSPMKGDVRRYVAEP